MGLVKGYRLFLSPWLGSSCRFEPTCSAYSLQALEQHGAAAGSYLTVRRLVRCHPWCDGGHDPVPATIAAQHAAFFAACSFQHPTILTKEVFMNDIRRTILWVIFGFSMVHAVGQVAGLHNGNKATFFPIAKTAVPAPLPPSAGGGACQCVGAVPSSNAVAPRRAGASDGRLRRPPSGCAARARESFPPTCSA
jgi:putative membrane protein insertion efficiency factor